MIARPISQESRRHGPATGLFKTARRLAAAAGGSSVAMVRNGGLCRAHLTWRRRCTTARSSSPCASMWNRVGVCPWMTPSSLLLEPGARVVGRSRLTTSGRPHARRPGPTTRSRRGGGRSRTRRAGWDRGHSGGTGAVGTAGPRHAVQRGSRPRRPLPPAAVALGRSVGARGPVGSTAREQPPELIEDATGFLAQLS